ncbi:MAG: hypothetical protein KatS3mg095_0572 [Candidatus Parcubacteria bacterium]|nr:MAG: hypothetical protein KatS3mg095_0572 [Candidatus Parcubacteria bacterium]
MRFIKKLKSIYHLISFLILLVLVKITFSQEIFKFFEFAPRSQEKITISTNFIEEAFIPFNDFLSGFDLFVNNEKITDLDITILDKNDQIFWKKKVGIPVINGGWWGKEYFITLGDNYPINSGEEYKIIIKGDRINSSIDLFVKNVLEMLQGSESYLYFPENLRKIKIDGVETNYTLKLALYENKETIPPIISNFNLEVINSQMVRITFNSNEPIIYSLRYRDNIDLTTSTFSINYFENCPYQIKDCQIILDVFPGRVYNFVLEAYDYWQNKTEKEGSFQVNMEESQKDNQIVTKESFQSNSNFDFNNTKKINELNQFNKNLSESVNNLDFVKKTEKTSNDKEKKVLSKTNENENLNKETIIKLNEQEKQKEKEITNSQKEKIISEEKINQTLTSSKNVESLNSSKFSKSLKIYIFLLIIFLFLLLSFLFIKRFKK